MSQELSWLSELNTKYNMVSAPRKSQFNSQGKSCKLMLIKKLGGLNRNMCVVEVVNLLVRGQRIGISGKVCFL